MGLDIAEFVMDVEDSFHIEIPEDSPFSPCRTPGALHDYIVAEYQRKGRSETSEEIWVKLVAIISKYSKYPVRRESRWDRDLGMD